MFSIPCDLQDYIKWPYSVALAVVPSCADICCSHLLFVDFVNVGVFPVTVMEEVQDRQDSV